MPRFSPTKHFNKLSISKKFSILIGLLLFIFLFQAICFWFVLDTMSGIRAYTAWEGMWSRAQKNSVVSLVKYSSSFEVKDYQRHLVVIKIPLGDKLARTELEKENPDYYFVRQGFLSGGNHPDDINNLIFLFEKFRSVDYVSQIIDIWAETDVLFEKQILLGEEIHSVISKSSFKQNLQAVKNLQPLVAELIIVDQKLTELEKKFSLILGESSRRMGNLLFIVLSLLNLLLAAIVFTIFLLISKVMTRVDKAKTEFVALASHQLKTPLTMIKLSTELLGDIDTSSLKSEEKKYIKNVAKEVPQKVTQMASLIDSILNVSRIELGTLVVEPKDVDIMKVVQKIVEEIRPLAKKKSLHIEESYEPSSLVIPIDPVLIGVVFHNLFTNAVKYSPADSKISISIVSLSSEILISISDTGYGIPKESHKKIFTKLYRAKNTGENDPGGTGLGLYIVKSIVTETGGKIWFQSEEGKGTNFYITFPLSGMKRKKGT